MGLVGLVASERVVDERGGGGRGLHAVGKRFEVQCMLCCAMMYYAWNLFLYVRDRYRKEESQQCKVT